MANRDAGCDVIVSYLCGKATMEEIEKFNQIIKYEIDQMVRRTVKFNQ